MSETKQTLNNIQIRSGEDMFNVEVGYIPITCYSNDGTPYQGCLFNSYAVDGRVYDIMTFLKILRDEGYIIGITAKLSYVKYLMWGDTGYYENIVPVVCDENNIPLFKTCKHVHVVDNGLYYTAMGQLAEEYGTAPYIWDYMTEYSIPYKHYQPGLDIKEMFEYLKQVEQYEIEQKRLEKEEKKHHAEVQHQKPVQEPEVQPQVEESVQEQVQEPQPQEQEQPTELQPTEPQVEEPVAEQQVQEQPTELSQEEPVVEVVQEEVNEVQPIAEEVQVEEPVAEEVREEVQVEEPVAETIQEEVQELQPIVEEPQVEEPQVQEVQQVVEEPQVQEVQSEVKEIQEVQPTAQQQFQQQVEQLANLEPSTVITQELQPEQSTEQQFQQQVEQLANLEPTTIITQELQDEEQISLDEIDENLVAEPVQETEPTEEEVQLQDNEPTEQEEPVIETSKFVFKDKMYSHVTREDVILNNHDIATGKSTYFKPRVKINKDLLYVENEEQLKNIYYLAKDREPLFNIDQDVLQAISNHFGKSEKYPLKVIFDAFHYEEIEGMLHIEILDESPNGLYEDLFESLYLFKIYSELTGKIPQEELPYLSIMRLISLSTLAQTAISTSVDYEDEDDDYASEEVVTLENNLLDETNDKLKEYLTKILINIPIYKENGELFEGLVKIQEICKRAMEEKPFRVEKDTFMSILGIPYMDIILKSNQVELEVSNTPLCPNAIGMLFDIFQRNYQEFKYELHRGQNLEPTEKDLEEGVNYNEVLALIQDSQDFASVYGITQYKPISDVFDMSLVVDFVVMPIINGLGKKVPLGMIATNINAVNINRNKVFLPFYGDYLATFGKLGISLDVDLVCAKNSKVSTHVTKPTAIKAIASQKDTKHLEVGHYTNLDELEDRLRRIKNLNGLTIPSFVKASEQSVMGAYSILGIK